MKERREGWEGMKVPRGLYCVEGGSLVPYGEGKWRGGGGGGGGIIHYSTTLPI